VDTIGFDYATLDSCSSSGLRQGSEAGIYFSVGDVYADDYWYLSKPGVSIVWTGDCTGTSSTCSVKGKCNYVGADPYPRCPAIGTKRATATVTYQGKTKVFNLIGIDDTRSNSGPIE